MEGESTRDSGKAMGKGPARNWGAVRGDSTFYQRFFMSAVGFVGFVFFFKSKH